MREKILRLLHSSGLVLSRWSHQSSLECCRKRPVLAFGYHSGVDLFTDKTPLRGPTKPFGTSCNPPCPPKPTDCPTPPAPTSSGDDSPPKPMKEDTTQPPEDDCEKGSGKKKLLLALLALLLAGLLAGGVYYWYINQNKPPPVVIEDTKCPKRVRRTPKGRFPPSSQEIPSEIPYLIIGGGTAAFAAFRSIKCADPKAKVLVISEDPFHPYMRPPLSKELIFAGNPERAESLIYKQSNGGERSIIYEPPEFFLSPSDLINSQNGGVAVAGGWKVKKICVEKKQITLEDDKVINYGKALLATGSSPRELPIFQGLNEGTKGKVSNYRGILDYQDLEDALSQGAKNIVVVGGGFLGCELSCGLSKRPGVKVTQIFLEDGVISHVLPKYLSRYAQKKMTECGIDVKGSRDIVKVTSDSNCIELLLDDGTVVPTEHVLIASGVVPNTELAEGSGLEVDSIIGGFLVNAELEARTDLYAAGDAACFYDPQFGRRRIEHHDQAIVSGRLAGENMTGSAKPFRHQPMFWSEFGPIVFEGIGVIDSELPTVGVFAKSPDGSYMVSDPGHQDPTPEESVDREVGDFKCPPRGIGSPPKDGESYDKGIIFYMEGKKIVGIVAWNLCNRMPTARQVLKSDREYDDLNEVAKLFNIHGKN